MNILETVGLVTFSVSGAYVGMQKEMDIFGVYILALTTALGGGILRDVTMDLGIPAVFTANSMIPVCLASATITIIIRRRIKFNTLTIALDALGLGAFSISAGLKALSYGFNFSMFLFMSLITAVGGGIMRDLLSGRLPVVLTTDVYAVASVFGSMFMWFSHSAFGIERAAYISVLMIFLIRMICYIKKINLPVLRIPNIRK